MRQEWDREWGSIGKEGNIWWLGSGKKEWVDVMGMNAWGWFCESPFDSIHLYLGSSSASGYALFPNAYQLETTRGIVFWMLGSILAWAATSAVLTRMMPWA